MSYPLSRVAGDGLPHSADDSLVARNKRRGHVVRKALAK